ncbi:MAG: NADH-quinone oxidoreductase subunit J [Phycisphaeraceae bacterium]|nr:NADH-quinone oxidoreductase subunit J [Phycisphaeraceae bacterium]
MSLPVVLYVASLVGAVAVYMLLPGESRRKPISRVAALVGIGALGLVFISLNRALDQAQTPGFFFYIFALIAVVSAVVVIAHPRPVYSALHFVMVVLASSGMLVLLQAEFMAFAMVIIYGGAILVTYMFVIMLATLPQTANEPETAASYDQSARQPLLSTLIGFLLIASLCGVMFSAPPREHPAKGYRSVVSMPEPRILGGGEAQLLADVQDLPGKFKPARVETALRRLGRIRPEDRIYSVQDVRLHDSPDKVVVFVRSSPGAARRPVELIGQDRIDFLNLMVHNIDRVGLNLFKGHTLGIELAAVILLLAMVGAVAISRRRIDPPQEAKGTPS